ncbi:MAG: glycogen debranching protein GlgX [Deltaproteobacteria bacterium]|nr:glycogen debranching protein GlgX [Deltaproteobacteria bacterium]
MDESTPSPERVSHGRFYPLGATLHPEGVNFALYSRHARAVELLLFDAHEAPPAEIIPLEHCTHHIWHVFVCGIRAGQLYGYRVPGDYEPGRALRFNCHKLLIDPYAKALTSKCRNTDNLLLDYDPAAPETAMDCRDNLRLVPKAIVMDSSFEWQDDSPPDIPYEELIIYEAHLKGFTAHESSGVRDPGTYLGFIEKIPYLKSLGINAVEFLPLHEFYNENFLQDRGLSNYWGYNSIGFFTPELSYSTCAHPGCQVREFKTLVRELHRAGIEVIMDVVYNHSGEGNHLGPTISFRGIDNPTYYRLDSAGRYIDITGCGNSLNLDAAPVMRMVMDSLRYWVADMHVDGFRFDLATALGREGEQFHKSSSFFDAISQDPVLNRVKIIAEPWDIETYQVGNFPVEWSEWNGRFRDTVRRFVRGDEGMVADLGWRLTGSADLYGDDGRSPFNSINFITCHDGFTLNDLVSYNLKHNEANCENNRDGSEHNFSWNCGVEGPTDDPDILALRRRLAKNFMCLLLFSSGTPMLTAGDEFLRTQQGNNNAYCQDNDISWIDWGLAEKNADMLAFCRKAIAFRRRYRVLQRRRFYQGQDASGSIPDIAWFGPDGREPQWNSPKLRTLCYQLHAAEGPEDCLLFVILNADPKPVSVLLPPCACGRWHRVVDTSRHHPEDFLDPGTEQPLNDLERYRAEARSVVVLLGKK